MQNPQTQPFGDSTTVAISSPGGRAGHPRTYCSVKSWSQVGNKHLRVDGLEVPGEVLAVELLPQLAPVCNVTIRLLSAKSREKIKLTSEASKEKKPKTPPEPGLGAEGSLLALPSSIKACPAPRPVVGSCRTSPLPGRSPQALAAHWEGWDLLASQHNFLV